MHSGPSNPTRREMLLRAAGGFGMVGLAGTIADATAASTDPLAQRKTHFEPKAKRVIFLFMNGGPSHVDTFDPKPELVKQSGKPGPGGKFMPSPFKFAKHGSSGIEVSELYPHVAKSIDDICVIRSMYTSTPNHEPGLLMMQSGNQQPIRPCMGSWLTYGLGTENRNLPGYVVLCPGKPVVGPALWSNSFLPGIYQGTHVDNGKLDPDKVIGHLRNGSLSAGSQRRMLDFLQKVNREHFRSRSDDPQLEARIESLEVAYRMQGEAHEAFDIRRESPATRQLYGKGEFADGCLIARRLVERGVRMVQVFYGNGQPWDAHGDIMDHQRDARLSDQPIAALIHDLKARGLWDDTLLVCTGEFGRTPFAQGKDGRDHNPQGFSCWLAGGAVKGGTAHGATDEFGYRAVSDIVTMHDLHATILHIMGVDHTRLTYRFGGRDYRLTDVFGNVVDSILA